jgi:hypothetical protein
VRGLVAAALAVLACVPVSAGELLFANGSRLAGELSNEALMVSTGSGLIEIAPEDVILLSRDEIRLRDGRVIRGTLVGGQIKAQTTLGEIAVKVDELQAYQGGTPSSGPVPAATPAAGAQARPGAPAVPSAPAGSTGASGGNPAGLPTIASYQDASSAGRPGNVQPAVLTRDAVSMSSRMLEVVGETGLYKEATSMSSQVGRVGPGQQVTFVDSIDRRLRILNLLEFDGGYWMKVRLSSGTEGWIPAKNVREVQ